MGGGNQLLIFVKFPERGKVKTRLARSIGRDAALALYRCFVADTISLSRQTGYPSLIFFHPPLSGSTMRDWLGRDLTYVPQTGRDLGERMRAAFQKAFQDCRRAVLIGTDCPDLPPSILQKAFNSLESRDAVIGPASDGGYYLIGFSASRLLPAAFRGIAWGSPTVFEATMQIFERVGADVHILPRWTDIDGCGDLSALLNRQKDLPAGKLSTVDYLRSQGPVTI